MRASPRFTILHWEAIEQEFLAHCGVEATAEEEEEAPVTPKTAGARTRPPATTRMAN